MINMQIVRNLYYQWLQEQDDFLLWHKATEYFKSDLWFNMRYILQQDDVEVGQFIKSYMEFANEEINKLKKE